MAQNVFMLACARLRKQAAEFPPEQALAEFLQATDSLYITGVTHSMRQEIIEKEVIAGLNNQGIPSLLIKGNALAREVYRDENSRTSGDIDILLKEEDLAKADLELLRMGYTRREEGPLSFWVHRLHHAVYHLSNNETILEMHWNFGIPGYFNLSSAAIWREVILIDSRPARLTPEMTLVLLLTHHQLHCFLSLRILVDILHAIHRYGDGIDPVAFVAKLHDIGLIKTALITLCQIHRLWGGLDDQMPPLKAFGREIERMGGRVSQPLVRYFSTGVERTCADPSFWDGIILRFSLDRWKRIAYSFAKVLFPAPKIVQEYYRDNRKCLLPVLYARFFWWRLTALVRK